MEQEWTVKDVPGIMNNEPLENQTCALCSTFFERYVEQVKDVANTTLEDAFTNICLVITKDENMCDPIVKAYIDIGVDSLAYRFFSSDFLCGQVLEVCDVREVNEVTADYIREVLADAKYYKKAPEPTRRDTYTVLHLTDTHWDDAYVVGVNMDCGSIAGCCHLENGIPKNPSEACGYWGALASADLPYRTIEATMDFIAREIKPDLIFWTGDSNDHAVWNHTVGKETVAAQGVAQAIQKYLPDVPLIPQLGNHECPQVDECNLLNGQSNTVWGSMKSSFGYWLNDDQLAKYLQNGYYTYFDEAHQAKWIVMNTQVWDDMDFWNIQNPTDPLGMLEWLRNELYDCEERQIPALIMGHISSGNNFANPSMPLPFSRP
jgi:sphingomyelin phosphodiesterase